MKLLKIITLSCLLQSFSSYVLGAEINDSKLLEDSINDMYVVAGAGMGGAVIGLSTLSFVEEPGDHLNNILVGAALGIIGGVAFVGYSTANKGRDMYYDAELRDVIKKEFLTSERVTWHRREMTRRIKRARSNLSILNFSANF